MINYSLGIIKQILKFKSEYFIKLHIYYLQDDLCMRLIT
jgi:hypothetical protein